MFALAVMLIAAMVCIEIMVVRNLPRFGRWIQTNPLKSLGFSLAVSVCMGLMFPAAGLVVMTAGVFSTLAVQPYYFCSRKWRETKTAWHNSTIHRLFSATKNK